MSNRTVAGDAAKTPQTVSAEGIMRYPVAEIFYTLQGEGANTGTAAVFIRLGGCDNGCPWCDSPEAQTTRNCRWMSGAEIASKVGVFKARTAVITGGEPLLRNLGPLTAELKKRNVYTALETSGTHPLSGDIDWVCISPKPFARTLDEVLQRADELKTVIARSDDFAFAEQCAAKTAEGCRLYLQPEWNGRKEILPAIVDYIKSHPAWHLSLQTHKYIDIP